MVGPAAGKQFIRGEVVQEAVEAAVVGMGEMGMNPVEALIAAEMILWTFLENGMRGSPTPAILTQTKAQALRVVTRLTSRVEAWPASTAGPLS